MVVACTWASPFRGNWYLTQTLEVRINYPYPSPVSGSKRVMQWLWSYLRELNCITAPESPLTAFG